MRGVTRPSELLKRLNREADVDSDLRPTLEHRVRKNVDALGTLRDAGLTWRQIANGLQEWRRPSGLALTADQLRGVYSRNRAAELGNVKHIHASVPTDTGGPSRIPQATSGKPSGSPVDAPEKEELCQHAEFGQRSIVPEPRVEMDRENLARRLKAVMLMRNESEDEDAATEI